MHNDLTALRDEELVSLYKDERSALAFEELCARYTVPLYRFSYTFAKERDLSEDIVQQTFVKMWKALSSFDTSKKFSVWVYTIARRTAIDELRKKKAFVFSALSDDDSVPFEETLKDDSAFTEQKFEELRDVDAFETVLKKLPEQKAEIIFLKLYEDMTFEEIAEALGKPMNTVKSAYRRTLLEIREELVTVYHVSYPSEPK